MKMVDNKVLYIDDVPCKKTDSKNFVSLKIHLSSSKWGIFGHFRATLDFFQDFGSYHSFIQQDIWYLRLL